MYQTKLYKRKKKEKKYRELSNHIKIFILEIIDLLRCIQHNCLKSKRNIFILLIFCVTYIALFFFILSSNSNTKNTITNQRHVQSTQDNEDKNSVIFSSSDSNQNEEITPTTNLQNSGQLDLSGSNVTLVKFLEAYEDFVELISPILDEFISKTPDPTGIEIVEFTSDLTIIGAQTFYNKAFNLAVLILIFLVFLKTIVFLYEENIYNYQFIKELVNKIILVSFFLLGGKQLMSYSIKFTNYLNQYFMNNQSLSEFINSFVDGIKSSVNDKQNIFINNLVDVFSFGVFDLLNFFKTIPFTLPMVLILVFLLFISLQFINRFVTLYFLVPLQPIATVFLFHKKTEKVFTSFWKAWWTTLIMQPSFILGLSIVQTMLFEGIFSNPSLVSIIIFLSCLIFLTSLNILVSRIFGDMWLAVGNNINAGVGIGSLLYAGQKTLSKIHSPANSITDRIKSSTQVLPDFNQGFPPSPTDQSSHTDQNDRQSKRTKIKETKDSDFVTSLKSLGYEVERNKQSGTVNVEGLFYMGTSKNGITNLYTSYEDASTDTGKEFVNQKYLENVQLVDPSNYKTRNKYNENISPHAIENGFGSSEVALRKNSSQTRLRKNLIASETYNNIQGIDGIISKRQIGDSKLQPKKLQLYVYSQKLS